MIKKILLIALIQLFFSDLTHAQSTLKTPFNEPPNWAKTAIWYQIFVERFYNGDKSNDPMPENTNVPPIDVIYPSDWAITPWTSDWYTQENWAKKSGKSFNDMLQYRRYGGDLQGVLNKLDYLKELGINSIFINPINDAPSLHKYDARNYHHIDVNFGGNPKADNALILTENPNDPSTWHWTSSDMYFLKVIEEAHKRGIKVIMDFSWNHVGTMFWAWQDILKNQEKSAYKDWFDIKSYDNLATSENEFSYYGWLGINSLPEIEKTNITTKRTVGYPYEGDINAGAKKHIFDVTNRWLAPNGDTAKGIDGFRLDVADQIGLGFWRDFRKYVRGIQPNAYLVGEIWWQEWPDNLMNPVPYTQGDVFDAVMFYQAYRPARYFFAKNDSKINAQQLKDSLEFQWNRLPVANRYAMMNVSSSHDAPRLLTDFYNPNKYKFHTSTWDNPNYKTGKPDAETYKRVQLYLTHLFTTIGAPQIFNGEEMGMWGADDPNCRKPLMWQEYNFDDETRNNTQAGEKQYDKVGFNEVHFNVYKQLILIRKNNPVLSNGDIKFLENKGNKLSYKRFNKTAELIVLFNLDNKKQRFKLPQKSRYIDLLTGLEFKGKSLEINGLTAAILMRK
jgi:cyclomaltodextrinase / maltogenic alpha-amylase / neopullulanase